MKFLSADELELDGLLVAPKHAAGIVVHVHGKCGNFYQNAFVATMLSGYPRAGFAFLSFNNRGHDCLAEAYRGSTRTLEYVGGSGENASQSTLDIVGALRFVRSELGDSLPVFLQGHSFGVDKIASGLRSRSFTDLSGLIILSPADSAAIIAAHGGLNWLSRATKAAEYVDQMDLPSGSHVFRSDLLGVRSNYSIPVAPSALISDSEAGMLNQIPGEPDIPECPPTFVYIGGSDKLQMADTPVWLDALGTAFQVTGSYCPVGGDHHFRGFEDELVRRASSWMSNVLMSRRAASK